MREYKFRVWDTYNERMVYDHYYFRKNDRLDWDDHRFNTPLEYAETWQDIEDGAWRPGYVMQFTGIADSKGTEIYEGDIYKTNGLFGSHVVKWDDDMLMWDFARHEDESIYNAQEIEVIGNIYENQ